MCENILLRIFSFQITRYIYIIILLYYNAATIMSHRRTCICIFIKQFFLQTVQYSSMILYGFLAVWGGFFSRDNREAKVRGRNEILFQPWPSPTRFHVTNRGLFSIRVPTRYLNIWGYVKYFLFSSDVRAKNWPRPNSLSVANPEGRREIYVGICPPSPNTAA